MRSGAAPAARRSWTFAAPNKLSTARNDVLARLIKTLVVRPRFGDERIVEVEMRVRMVARPYGVRLFFANMILHRRHGYASSHLHEISNHSVLIRNVT